MPNNPQQRIHISKNDIPVSSLTSRRIVLLGKTGVGKSAVGNTILGQKEFRSVMSMNAVTRECSEAHATVSGRSVSVVDTPGFFDTKMNPEEFVEEMARSMYLSSPGPHAFLIVFPVNMRFTEQEEQIPQKIEIMFGEQMLKYSVVLFTHGDLLEGESVEELIKENDRLRRLVEQCGGRYQVFNNKDLNNREQVNELLQKIDSMIEQNGGGYYSNQMFEDAYRIRQEEEERRLREEEQKLRQAEERRQEDIDIMRRETEERTRAEIEAHREAKQERERQRQRKNDNQPKQPRTSGFKQFLSKYKRYIYLAAIAAGFVIGGAVGGAAVYGAVCGAVVGGGAAGAVLGGAETGTVTGVVAGAAVGAVVGGVVGGAVVGAAAAASVGAVAHAVGVGVVGGAVVGGAAGGASSGSAEGAFAGALGGAVVGGVAVGGAAVGAALSGVVGGAAVCGAVAGGAAGGAVVGGAVSRNYAGAVAGGAVVGGAVLAGAGLGGDVVGGALQVRRADFN